ncbi:GNAT family N-acetyltransferase [Tetragenococcus solitarius]|uniref:GNAT family N-acetyltransferase n=1 Tax=Tetragenococcus solitarius TaxID=71453 RepID=A0ABN3YDC6_9ENTE|nr:GNAT family N-acetyltransferase [Tetragenococcus solitarius]
MIRTMELKDASAIQNINKESLRYDFPIQDTLEKLKIIQNLPNNQIYVYEKEEQVIGYIHLADYENTYHKSLKNILTLAVLPKKQGQGVASQLLEAGQNWAKKQGSAGIRLVSGFERKSAQKFYEAKGFRKRKDQINYIKWWG